MPKFGENSNYPAAEWRALASTEPIDPNVVLPKLRSALDDAEAFVSRMPTDKIGLLFLQAGKVVQPDPDILDSYRTHAGQTETKRQGAKTVIVPIGSFAQQAAFAPCGIASTEISAPPHDRHHGDEQGKRHQNHENAADNVRAR